MCHAFLTDANFYQLLFQIDESIAEEASSTTSALLQSLEAALSMRGYPYNYGACCSGSGAESSELVSP